MVCSLHSVTTGSRDRANVSLIIIFDGGNSHDFGICLFTRGGRGMPRLYDVVYIAGIVYTQGVE